MPRTKSSPGIETRRRAAKPVDAISLLKADHRQVKSWFAQFEKERGDDRKLELATSICAALKVHTLIEEEIFYPAYLEATGDRQLHHEAAVEHEAAGQLIATIDASSPADDFYDAKVRVLAEMVRHHIEEEERPGGMFARAKKSTMNLPLLGERMRDRKFQSEGQISAAPPPVHRGRDGILGRILAVASR
jgi:hemerythrin superfamily protein